MTMSSLSPLSLLSVESVAANKAIGATIASSVGSDRRLKMRKTRKALALAGDQIELAQRLRHPDHGGERKADRQEGGTNRPENVALDENHRPSSFLARRNVAFRA